MRNTPQCYAELVLTTKYQAKSQPDTASSSSEDSVMECPFHEQTTICIAYKDDTPALKGYVFEPCQVVTLLRGVAIEMFRVDVRMCFQAQSRVPCTSLWHRTAAKLSKSIVTSHLSVVLSKVGLEKSYINLGWQST